MALAWPPSSRRQQRQRAAKAFACSEGVGFRAIAYAGSRRVRLTEVGLGRSRGRTDVRSSSVRGGLTAVRLGLSDGVTAVAVGRGESVAAAVVAARTGVRGRGRAATVGSDSLRLRFAATAAGPGLGVGDSVSVATRGRVGLGVRGSVVALVGRARVGFGPVVSGRSCCVRDATQGLCACGRSTTVRSGRVRRGRAAGSLGDGRRVAVVRRGSGVRDAVLQLAFEAAVDSVRVGRSRATVGVGRRVRVRVLRARSAGAGSSGGRRSVAVVAGGRRAGTSAVRGSGRAAAGGFAISTGCNGGRLDAGFAARVGDGVTGRGGVAAIAGTRVTRSGGRSRRPCSRRASASLPLQFDVATEPSPDAVASDLTFTSPAPVTVPSATAVALP